MGLLSGKKNPVNVPPKRIVEGIPHGSHWNAIIDSEQIVMQKMQESMQNGFEWGETHWKGRNIEQGKEMKNVTYGVMSADPYLRVATLLTNKSVWTAFPFSAITVNHPVIITEVKQWENLIEGWLSLSVCGASLNIFDTGFFRHMGNIESSNVIFFSGIAYSIKKAEPWTIDANGQQFNNKGSSIILPSERGAIDDYNIQMPVEKVDAIDIWGRKGYRFLGPLIRGVEPGPPFVIPIIASEKAILGSVPQPGDDLSGTIWLQGFIKDERYIK